MRFANSNNRPGPIGNGLAGRHRQGMRLSTFLPDGAVFQVEFDGGAARPSRGLSHGPAAIFRSRAVAARRGRGKRRWRSRLLPPVPKVNKWFGLPIRGGAKSQAYAARCPQPLLQILRRSCRHGCALSGRHRRHRTGAGLSMALDVNLLVPLTAKEREAICLKLPAKFGAGR